MSGHSKWANIKYRKAAQDSKRGKLFQKLVKAIITAAREGGGDPSANVALKNAIEKAKEANVPMENIQRAIKRGTGEIEGASYEQVIYEGYGPGGVAILVEAMTDNRNRTASDMRYIFTRHGGSLGEAGCVSWVFEKRGAIYISSNVDEDELLMTAAEAGASDVVKEDSSFIVYTDPTALNEVSEFLSQKGYPIDRCEITMIPKNTVSVTDINDASKLLKLLDALEDHDDVQNVYANFDIPDEIFDQLESA
ncbi:MAG TPA: YebC/PmpR family DNA-binding transcriptional regulator [Acetomicrobium flavidum]|uniref:Probable transcriptional regulatory protein Anamo_0702 n=2 Tax=Acetomicrobium TaxID=49894 RepID=I4BVP3_ACEMN|nr:YebC/PmpR family DNA-binding transcriptional regulator [Acetomicrobium mobile]NLG95025.1 YebC/PmpR family DNA-binding transcriptional regulator [Acetomicrobium flavidum]AFM21350.1 DNA-binding regulatory protein, YebC/PmpR family [Acetomicrobium mobile DSM 13181]SIN63465.1 DNA-binding regulatory protein, YebC/PmpR family [Acetomicrobium flavidum]HOJ82092.1 YebC/PmpR family DNA-binding transcriptional regulator [Acetomicrobium flavidum]HOM31210.1 YebC/PmpR family DNA-binding transcriptional r